jgi:hypothetical protein
VFTCHFQGWDRTKPHSFEEKQCPPQQFDTPVQRAEDVLAQYSRKHLMLTHPHAQANILSLIDTHTEREGTENRKCK